MVLGRMGRTQGLVYGQDQALCPQGGERLLVCVGHCGFSLGSGWDQQREAPSSPPCWGGEAPGAAQTGAVTSCFHQLPAALTPEPLRAWLMAGGPFCHILTCCQSWHGAGCGAMLLKIISIKGPLGHSATLSHAMGKNFVLHCLNTFPPSK